MTRVVADTNGFISGLLFGGLPKSFLDLAFLGGCQLVASVVLVDELERNYWENSACRNPRVRQVRLGVERHAAIVTPQIRLAVVQDDPDDDRVLECALLAKRSLL